MASGLAWHAANGKGDDQAPGNADKHLIDQARTYIGMYVNYPAGLSLSTTAAVCAAQYSVCRAGAAVHGNCRNTLRQVEHFHAAQQEPSEAVWLSGNVPQHATQLAIQPYCAILQYSAASQILPLTRDWPQQKGGGGGLHQPPWAHASETALGPAERLYDRKPRILHDRKVTGWSLLQIA